MTSPVRVRYAPSPTGFQHVGNIRTAIFNWLWARHTGGTFILRIEDTDRKRYKEGALEDLYATFEWLDLDIDEGPSAGGDAGPYFQSERLPLYHRYAQELIDAGGAYECYCAPKDEEPSPSDDEATESTTPVTQRLPDPCRNLSAEERERQRAELAAQGRRPIVRLKAPFDGKMLVQDLARGEIAFENKHIPDYVLLKSDGFPTYHLANVVDDHLMEITHIMRGDEWISTAPMHVLMYRFFGWEPPLYAHLPMILDPSGHGKLSKRKQVRPDGTVVENMTQVREFRAAGYLPEAIFNFLASYGWAISGDQELFTKDEAIAAFELTDIKKSPARFEYDKLEWMNGVYIRQLTPADLATRLVPFMQPVVPTITADQLLPLIPAIQERLKTLAEAPELLDIFFVDARVPDPQELVQKKMTLESTHTALQAVRERLATVEWEHAAIEATMRSLADELGLKAGPLFTPIRLAVTGKKIAPPLFDTLVHLGRDQVLARIDQTLARFGEVKTAL